MRGSAEASRRPAVPAALGSALLALALAATQLGGPSDRALWPPIVVGALSLLVATVSGLRGGGRGSGLALAAAWILGVAGTGLLGALDAGALSAWSVVGPLCALLLVGRREAAAAFAIALGAVWAQLGARAFGGGPSSELAVEALHSGLGAGLFALAYAASSVRTRATGQARERAARARALLAGLPDSVLRLDAKGRIVDASWRPPLAAPRGWEGRAAVELLPELGGLGVLGPGVTGEAPVDVELCLDGRRRTLEARAQPTPGGGRIVVLRDVSEARAQAFEQRSNDLHEQRASSFAQTQVLQVGRLAHMGVLATGVAHEINNPLAYVLGNLEYAIDGVRAEGAPSDLEEALVEAAQGAKRIRDIVEDIRMFSRADDSDLLELSRLADVATAAIRVVRGQLGARVELIEEHAPAPPVFANPSRLAQVVVNLLLNAIQAIPEDRGAPGRVVLRTGTSPSGEAFVEVEDDGVGIRPEHRRRVFEPFFTTRPVGQGTGLGLAICYGLVRRLGGAVDVESEEGRGATFRIRLPDGEVLLEAS